MIKKLLDSQSFSKVWKSTVRQTFCAIVRIRILCNSVYDRVTLSADRLRNTSFSLIRRKLQTLRKIYIGYVELRLKTCDNVKSVIVWNVSFRLCFPRLQKYRSKQFYDFQLIEASVLEVIKSRKLQHLRRSSQHEAFQKVKHKLDLIEQPYLDKIHSR